MGESTEQELMIILRTDQHKTTHMSKAGWDLVPHSYFTNAINRCFSSWNHFPPSLWHIRMQCNPRVFTSFSYLMGHGSAGTRFVLYHIK